MSGGDYVDPNPQYWQDYTNLQHVKHELIREYLGGWFPILASWAGRILYIDTHAGRGRHATGARGSPLVSLKAFLDHPRRDRILQSCEVRFIFMERDRGNLKELEAELAAHEPLPDRVLVEKYSADFHDVMARTLGYLRRAGRRMAPSFIFVDPYGFNLSYPLLRDFMAFEAVELFINVMWRHLDMAIAQARSQMGMADLLDFMFGGPAWANHVTSSDFETRCEQAVSLVQSTVASRWATSVRMLGSNSMTEYVLLHLSNHDAGRDLMKTVMWKVCPSCDGTFVARKADDPAQGILLTPDPDLRPLRDWVLATLNKRPTRWRTLQEMLRDQSWLDKHLNEVVRALRREDSIIPSAYQGRFTPSSNPLLALSPKGSPENGGESGA